MFKLQGIKIVAKTIFEGFRLENVIETNINNRFL